MMNSDSAQRIKLYLENIYDIPFEVGSSKHYPDNWYDIKPHNNAQELFDIEVRFKNHLRLTIEVNPEKYSAFSINDMSAASDEKKRLFAEYASQLEKRRAKVEFYVNGHIYEATRPESWPETWSSYRMRISRSPICAEDEEFDEVEIASTWASIVTGMFLSLLNVTLIDPDEHYEGGVKRIETNRYERNPVNRELCLSANGYKCKICGFDFESIYGKLGRKFIHVHHIVPVSKMSEVYMINPVSDMIPVCPNCHAMLHQQDPPLSPEQLREIIRFNRNGNEEGK